MKPIRLASLAMATAALLASVTSCKSDPNPFDITITTPTSQEPSAYIRLNLSVENTRAVSPTPAEKVINKVSIFVFDKNQKLEISETNVTLDEGEESVVLKVSHGLKTIYAIAGYDITDKSNMDYEIGMSISDFEKLTFDSTLDKLMTESGHTLIGKSDAQQVMISASEEEMPESNKFSIELTSAMAKAQVLAADFEVSPFGISFGNVKFKAMQTCDKMMVVHDGTDIFGPFTNSTNGTYSGYSIRDNEIRDDENDGYQDAVTSGFTGIGCEYMPENIVTTPLSGNTTFLSLKIATTPEKYYTFATTDDTPHAIAETPNPGTTYYVVGIADRTHGISDYTVGSDGHIFTFKDSDDAAGYASKLNKGEVSPITVSQTESQLRAPSTRAGETGTTQFEVFMFEDGEAYYRVNIAHTEDNGSLSKVINKVVRNKFYKVNINSVRSLGFCDESLLRPTNPAAQLDAEGSSWISASFTVAPWDEVGQDVDL